MADNHIPATYLSTIRITAYALPALGISFLLFFVQFYLLKFGTDVLLLSPALVGTIMAGAKLWDAVSDPLVGNWSDRTRSRLGRRRPWMLAALPVMIFSFVGLWSLDPDLPSSVKALAIAAILIVFYTGFTLYSVPHASLGAELSTDSHQRTRAFGARHIFWTVGLFAAFAAIQSAGAPDASFSILELAVLTGGVAALICLVTPLSVPERKVSLQSGGSGLFSAFRDIGTNRKARILYGVWFIENLGAGVLGAIAPFYATYVLGEPGMIGILPAVYALAGIASIPIWVQASRRFGKKPVWLIAMACGGAGFASTWFVTGSTPLLLAVLALAGAGMGCGGALSNAVLADIIDEEEARTGERKEGSFTAGLNFFLKAGVAASTALGGLMLSVSGFVPNEMQSAQTIEAIRFFFAALPAAGFALGILLFSGYSSGRRTGEAVAV